MAPKGTKFTRLILVVDEEQVALMCPEEDELKRPYGGTKKTSRFFRAARKINNQGRAVDVLLWQGTQDPTDQNLPKLVREGAHIRASLVVGTESQARMALGDKAIDGGAEPHKLRQGLDKGVVVVAGDGVKLEPGQASITVRTHYVDTDQAHEIAERAKARRSAVATKTHVEPVAQVYPLADIAAVLGDVPRMKTVNVLHRLTELNRGEYEDWTPQDLKAFLAEVGCEPHKSNGNPVVDRDRVLEAIADRAIDDVDDYEE
ncbi:hypothetical protein DN069_21425 [Streptacidiphilus pinicola]|uniref:Uncharacterized protein n=1 Tax=Streptacidiphilus pinicola TaxID=2219663 RepID=A0A2X0K7Q3_9ACTN|nr:hypothetical protein DN069_21425 [Streptacidiphilus pinicola]